MAFMDDAKFVISQIRHSCVTSDNTGMSEIVIVNEETENEKLLQRKKFGNNWENGDFIGKYSDSFDIDVSPIISSGDFPVPANSIIERKNPSSKNSDPKCRNVTWKDPKHTDIDFSKAFDKKQVDKVDGKATGSLLAKLIGESLNQPKNPFASYGKFDGKGYARSDKIREFKIFFPPTGKRKQQAQMNVFLIVNGAHVQDLIGLIMFKYTQQEIKPELKGDVKSYCLLIADELDGEVDFDLPPLDSNELISKFDFRALALSYIKEEPKEEPEQAKPKSGIIVEVSEEKQGSSKFTVNGLDLQMEVVMEKVLKKRNLKRTGHEYVLVKKNDPKNAIALKATLESMETLEFRLVKRTSINSVKKDIDKNGGAMPNQDEIFTSEQYKSFKVAMLHRFGPATEVQLGIDSRKIEIQQATQSSQRDIFGTLLNRSTKAVTIEMDDVVNSEVMKTSGNRSTFRIIYSTGNHNFKNYDFECPQGVAGEIARKIQLILNSCPKSESRLEYQKVKPKDKRAKKS